MRQSTKQWETEISEESQLRSAKGTKYDWFLREKKILGVAPEKRNKDKRFTGWGKPKSAAINLRLACGFSDRTWQEHLIYYLEQGFLTGEAEKDAIKLKEE